MIRPCHQSIFTLFLLSPLCWAAEGPAPVFACVMAALQARVDTSPDETSSIKEAIHTLRTAAPTQSAYDLPSGEKPLPNSPVLFDASLLPGGELKGSLVADPGTIGCSHLFIRKLFVPADVRRTGIGSCALAWARVYAHRCGCASVRLYPYPFEAPTTLKPFEDRLAHLQAWYHRNGFLPCDDNGRFMCAPSSPDGLEAFRRAVSQAVEQRAAPDEAHATKT